MGPHCIGPNTWLDAEKSRYPNSFSKRSMFTVRVHDWNPWSEMNKIRSSGRARETNEPSASSTWRKMSAVLRPIRVSLFAR